MSEDYEFEDDDQPVSTPSKDSGGGSFDAFADEDVGAPDKPAPPAPKPSTPSSEAASSDGGFDAFADGDVGDADAGDADIKPGQGKDMWKCPHCGAKNKKGRENCRACGKHPDEEVIVPLMSQKPVQIGVAVGAVVILYLIFAIVTAKDLSLRSPGADSVTDDFIFEGEMIAGSGRVMRYTAGGGNTDVIVVFGYEINGKEFKDLKGPNKNNEVTRKGFGIQPHIRLSVSGKVSSMKRGDYVSFSGAASTDDASTRKYKTSAEDMQFEVASP